MIQPRPIRPCPPSHAASTGAVQPGATTEKAVFMLSLEYEPRALTLLALALAEPVYSPTA